MKNSNNSPAVVVVETERVRTNARWRSSNDAGKIVATVPIKVVTEAAKKVRGTKVVTNGLRKSQRTIEIPGIGFTSVPTWTIVIRGVDGATFGDRAIAEQALVAARLVVGYTRRTKSGNKTPGRTFVRNTRRIALMIRAGLRAEAKVDFLVTAVEALMNHGELMNFAGVAMATKGQIERWVVSAEKGEPFPIRYSTPVVVAVAVEPMVEAKKANFRGSVTVKAK